LLKALFGKFGFSSMLEAALLENIGVVVVVWFYRLRVVDHCGMSFLFGYGMLNILTSALCYIELLMHSLFSNIDIMFILIFFFI
jgi:hypothetical protein